MGAIILDISIAVLAVLLGVFGGVVSALTLEHKLLKYGAIGLFTVLGLASVVLVVLQSQHTQNEQVDARKRQERLQSTLEETRLDSAKSISFLSGRLDAFASLLSNPPANQDLRRIAEAIRQTASSGPTQASNAQLKTAALDLARRLRDFQLEMTAEEYKLQSIRAYQSTDTEEERNRKFREYLDRLTNQFDRRRIAFGPLRVEAQNMEFQLLSRLPPQPRNNIARMVLDTSALAGPSPVSDLADYIERLVSLLPAK
jgi:hypothetical protein